MLIFSLINERICLLMKRFSYYGIICVNFILQKGRMVNNMEEKKKVVVVSTKLALDILSTIYKTGEKICTTMCLKGMIVKSKFC